MKKYYINIILLLSQGEDGYTISVGNECISNGTNEKLLGITFDNRFNFNSCQQIM